MSERRNLIILGLFPLSEAIAWTSIFPYIYAMVESFSASDSDSTTAIVGISTATYAAIMVSVFTFGEFIMAPQWASISDRIGRKPTLLIGSVGAMISAMIFGLSNSLPVAIAARAFAGLANPNLGVVKTYVGEMVRKDGQAKGFSIVSFFRGLGTIVGPLIGGYLAEPVKNYPFLFRSHTIWDRFPYLLPNLVVVVCLIISCSLCFLLLQEVHSEFRGRIDTGRRISLGISNFLRGKRWSEIEIERVYTSIGEAESSVELLMVDETERQHQHVSEYRSLNRRLAFTKQVCLQILSSAILGYLKVATLATVPIFLATPSKPASISTTTLHHRSISLVGGLGLDTRGVSNVLLVQAAAAIVTQILLVPTIIEKKGALRSYQLALSILICLYCVMPFAAALPRYLGIAAIVIDLCVYALINGLGTTCSAILITNTTPSPAYLATVNGAATSLGCLARTLGPLVSGPLFRLGVSIKLVGLPFWALGAVAGAGLVLMTFLKDYP